MQQGHMSIYNQGTREGQWKEMPRRICESRGILSDHLSRALLGDKMQRVGRHQGRGLFFKWISSIPSQTGFYRLDRETQTGQPTPGRAEESPHKSPVLHKSVMASQVHSLFPSCLSPSHLSFPPHLSPFCLPTLSPLSLPSYSTLSFH